MKTKIKLLVVAAFMLAITQTNAQIDRIPIVPMGIMSASPNHVQVGTFPTLSWSIVHPKSISDVATIVPPSSILLNSPMYVSVQMIGSKVTVSDPAVKEPSTEARISISNSAYCQLFYGNQSDVDSAYSLYIKKLNSNTTINFGGRYTKGATWSNLYTSRNTNFQVIALKNGDIIPTIGLYDDIMAPHLAPYVDASNKVKIGPMSVLILMELGDTDHHSSCFDYSDQVLLVSFSAKHPNNGHGNNLDGVDSSNPGQGSGGPNGDIDPSSGVDDEK